VRADTTNLKAYDRYLKARELFIGRSDLPESIRLFEEVVEMDPAFARGWEGLAAVTSVAPSWGIRDRDYAAMAIKAANRASEARNPRPALRRRPTSASSGAIGAYASSCRNWSAARAGRWWMTRGSLPWPTWPGRIPMCR